MPQCCIQNLSFLCIPVEDPSKTLLAHIHAYPLDWMHACGTKGRCTTCRAQIMSGMENLSPLSEAEKRFLSQGRLLADERLMCQVFLIAGEVIVAVPGQTQLPHLRYS
jgi:2Fe-2S ferredoxin